MILRELLRAKRRVLVNYRRSDEGGWRRLAVFSILGALVWIGILLGSHWFLGKVVAIEPVGVVMLRKLLGLVLLFATSILVVSNLIAAFSTYYLADDLQLLVAKPIPPNALYAARFAENCVYAAWMPVFFVTPFFLAAGWVMSASAGYYATLLVVLAALAIFPTSISVILCLVLGVLFSARRTRQVLLFVATLVFATLFILFRSLEPERFLNPDERAPLLEVLGRLQTGDSAWLPSTWAADALWVYLGYAIETRTHPLALLITGSVAAFFAGGWVFRALYRRAFSRAQEGVEPHHAGAAGLRGRSTDVAAVVAGWLRRDRPSLRSAMLRKDLLVFLRDTTQWSQTLLVAAIVVIYVVNFSYIRSAGEAGIISQNALHFINVALGGFVAVAVCVRFAFPSVSLEGRAFWIVLRSPNAMVDFLRSKWLSLAVPLVVLVNILVVITNLWLGSGTVRTIAAACTVTPLTIGLSGLALGLGARYPRFNIDNAAKIATGFGGVLYMFIGLFLLIAVVLAAAMPTLWLARFVEHGDLPTPGRLVLAVTLAIAAIALPLAAGRIAVALGADHLQTRALG